MLILIRFGNMLIARRILIIVLIFCTFIPVIARAQPDIQSTSGAWVHGGSVTITSTGSNFGSKSPAAPLIWDDAEGRTTDSDAAVTNTGWSDPWPRTDGDHPECNIRYHDIPFRNQPAPHQYSKEYLAGCHYQEDDNDPVYVSGKYQNVGVTVDNGSFADYWYVHFYYKLDPLWNTSDLTYNNHKFTVAQTTALMYTPGSGVQQYTAACGSNGPAPVAGTDQVTLEGHQTANELGTCGEPPPYANNPIDNWIKWEETVDPQDSKRHVYVDNKHILQQTKSGDYRSFSIGGYYRRCPGCPNLDNTDDYRGGVLDSNYRYFDDMYIDNTTSRVMLCNSSTYPTTDSFICEPQIPSAWSTSEITVTVNLGALTGDTAYLFVFDSSNDANATGYEVTIGVNPSSIGTGSTGASIQ